MISLFLIADTAYRLNWLIVLLTALLFALLYCFARTLFWLYDYIERERWWRGEIDDKAKEQVRR